MYNNNNNNNEICPICLSEFQEDFSGNSVSYAITSCGHKFCLPCIVRHGKNKYTCPMCRQIFLDPCLFSPRESINTNLNGTFRSNDDLPNLENITTDNYVSDDVEISTWYYGSWEERLQEFNRRENAYNINISDIAFDTSSTIYQNTRYMQHIRNRNNEYFAFDEEIVGVDNILLEPEPESYTNIQIRDISNCNYDEIISLSSSEESINFVDISINTV